jgi:hypothetical protein
VCTVHDRKFVVISVDEFDELPVICARGAYSCRVGAVYVRTRRKPETSEIPSQTEMRELLNLATDKALAAFLARTRRAGIGLPPHDDTTDAAAKFDAELADELQGTRTSLELTNEIARRGHWLIRIHPVRYIRDRIPYRQLEETISRAKVQLRGSDFRRTDSSLRLDRDVTFIGSSMSRGYYREAWRFYQSGQFVTWIGMREDWIDPNQHYAWGPPRGIAVMGIDDALYRFTEVFTFAAHLALTAAGDDPMCIEVEIRNLRRRRLWVDSPHRWPFDNVYEADFHTYPFETIVAPADLQANYKDLAVKATADLVSRFGWNPPDQMLVEQQNKLRF